MKPKTPNKETDNADNVDFKILRDASWLHNGAPIKRSALAKLFADRALKIDENGKYWLQTPFEKYAVDVEDVPFILTDFEDTGTVITFKTNMDEQVSLDEHHPLELRIFKNDQGDPLHLPYMHVRDGLYARMSRNVYYALIHKYGSQIKSAGNEYALGHEEN